MQGRATLLIAAMSPTIQPIETIYKSHRFRSRMEARWAVFMDTAGIPWIYEPDAYDLGDGLRYLPDFYLPSQDVFLEVKNPNAPKQDYEKVRRLVALTHKTAYVFVRPPAPPDWSDYDNEGATAYFWCSVTGDDNSDDPKEDVGSDNHYVWCECPVCRRLDVQFDGRSDRIKCACPKSPHGDKGYNYESQRLMEAYGAATSYRFEPGAFNPAV